MKLDMKTDCSVVGSCASCSDNSGQCCFAALFLVSGTGYSWLLNMIVHRQSYEEFLRNKLLEFCRSITIHSK